MSENNTTDRRSFLKLASVGTASALAATAGAQTANASELKDDGSGYSETEHVKKVYELSRF